MLMKFLITSDNHLGFKETDPIRFDDSFNTFEEIMAIAKSENVDMILQSGDLFDENRPSRNTYNKTLKILSEYCLGDEKPKFSCSIPLNCQKNFLNVSLPILSIHGNHDDPSGFNSVSPLDVLHSSGLVNYFGRVKNVDEIEVEPILLENNCRVAIYGIGHIKDRRLQRTFMNEKVIFKQPPGGNWYKILMVHQNRTPREDGYISEDLINPIFDLVIYGHEHESIKINHKNFDAIQCGSTIRTSLCEGEGMEKFVYILSLQDKPSISRIELKTVRPLVIENIKVTKDNPETQVNKKIENILETIKFEHSGSNLLPLVRLRVDLSGVQDFNRHKIQELLQGKIANPTDAIRITRKIEKEKEIPVSIIQKYEISDIFRNIIDSFDLKTLIQPKIVESVSDFVNKDIKEAFTILINESVEGIVKNINFEDLVADSIDEAIKTAVARMRKEVAIEENHNEEYDKTVTVSESVECNDNNLNEVNFVKNSNHGLDNLFKMKKEKIKENLSNIAESIVDNKTCDTKESQKRMKLRDSSDDDLLNFI